MGAARFEFAADDVFLIANRQLVFASRVQAGEAQPGDRIAFDADDRQLVGRIRIIEHKRRCVEKTLVHEHISIALVDVDDKGLSAFLDRIEWERGYLPEEFQAETGISVPATLRSLTPELTDV